MQAEEVGLTSPEYMKIVELMHRKPNDLELGLFGALWSEHCSYKSTKALLSRLPHDGPHVVQGPGANAGVVRLDQDIEVAFKVESHNHPSYVEPVQGAATGVGGILRDIVAMGARPVALADLLRFGIDAHSLILLDRVVKGVGQYGNAIGIPTVIGDLAFSDTYRGNPLVNVMAVGLRSPEMHISASTARPGQWLLLVGQRTGRDGIHGASLLASRDFTEGDDDLRPTVQVGDPFLGKLLMEATLKAVSEGLLAALQDLGAAGLASATAELCDASGVGAELWLDRVPLRQKGLTAYDIMLSETQERMLLVTSDENLSQVVSIFEHQEILCSVIGHITASKELAVQYRDRPVASVRPDWLIKEAPRRPLSEAQWVSLKAPVAGGTAIAPAFDPRMVREVLSDRDVRDRRPIYRRYDSTIRSATIWGPSHDSAILRVRGSDAGLAIAVFGTGRWASVDPYAGGVGAVLLVLARLAAQGAEPLGLTDGVNAGNPDLAESYDAMAALVRGVADAARAAGVPVTGGNVSLHNETDGQAIWPTVMMGGVGRQPHPYSPLPDYLTASGDLLFLINPSELNLGGSVVALHHQGMTAFPRVDLRKVPHLLKSVSDWALSGVPRAMRAVGPGGLGAVVVRMMQGQTLAYGVEMDLKERDSDLTARLFNEVPLQWVTLVDSRDKDRAMDYWGNLGVEVTQVGVVNDTGTLSFKAQGHSWPGSTLLEAWHRPFEEGAYEP